MTTLFVDPVRRFSLEEDDETGRTFLAIPVRNASVEYTEWYAVERAVFETFRSDPTLAHELAAKAKRREVDHLLLLRPGVDRGVAD